MVANGHINSFIYCYNKFSEQIKFNLDKQKQEYINYDVAKAFVQHYQLLLLAFYE